MEFREEIAVCKYFAVPFRVLFIFMKVPALFSCQKAREDAWVSENTTVSRRRRSLVPPRINFNFINFGRSKISEVSFRGNFKILGY